MLCEAEFATQEELEGHQLSCGGADPITVTCIKCGIAFPEDEIEGHQLNCTFIKCFKCAVILMAVVAMIHVRIVPTRMWLRK